MTTNGSDHLIEPAPGSAPEDLILANNNPDLMLAMFREQEDEITTEFVPIAAWAISPEDDLPPTPVAAAPMVTHPDIVLMTVDFGWGQRIGSSSSFFSALFTLTGRQFSEVEPHARATGIDNARMLAGDILAERRGEGDFILSPEDEAFRDLCHRGLLVDSGRRRLNRAGRPSIVWVAVEDHPEAAALLAD